MSKIMDPNALGFQSLWDSETAQETAQYLTEWLGWHNASTNEMRW
jgi:hypothetical protein